MYTLIDQRTGRIVKTSDDMRELVIYVSENLRINESWGLYRMGESFSILLLSGSTLFAYSRFVVTRAVVELTDTFYSLDNVFSGNEVGGEGG